jgi:hypothetical protein
MKNQFLNLFFTLTLFLLYGCNDEATIPKLECNQPNFTVNQSTEKVRDASTATATKYLYDDTLEAYVVSSDEGGNFFKTISLQTLPTATNPAVGFSVSVDASILISIIGWETKCTSS